MAYRPWQPLRRAAVPVIFAILVCAIFARVAIRIAEIHRCEVEHGGRAAPECIEAP